MLARHVCPAHIPRGLSLDNNIHLVPVLQADHWRLLQDYIPTVFETYAAHVQHGKQLV